LVASILAVGFSTPDLLAGIPPTPFRTGLFGITDTQAVRVSFFNDRVQKVCPAP
jgi:hypothetical protein